VALEDASSLAACVFFFFYPQANYHEAEATIAEVIGLK